MVAVVAVVGGGGGAVVGGGVVGFGAVVGVLLCSVVGVERRAVLVVPRPKVVLGPEVVDGPLDVVSGAVVVVDDEDVVWPWTTISRGLPAELGMPAMAIPRPMQTRRRRTIPARLVAGPCQSMAGKPNDPEFFCRGSIRNPTSLAGKRLNSNGPVTPYKVRPGTRRPDSNTVPTRPRTVQKRWSGDC